MFQVSILTSCQSIKYVTVKNNGSFIFYYFEIILNNNEITSVGGKKNTFLNYIFSSLPGNNYFLTITGNNHHENYLKIDTINWILSFKDSVWYKTTKSTIDEHEHSEGYMKPYTHYYKHTHYMYIYIHWNLRTEHFILVN